MRPPKGGGWWWSYNALYQPGCPLKTPEKEVYHLLTCLGRGETRVSHHAIAYMAARTPLGETAIKAALPRLKELGMIGVRRVKTRLGLRENEYTVLPREAWKWGDSRQTTVAAAQPPKKTGESSADRRKRWSPRDRSDSRQATRTPKTKYSRQEPVAVADSEPGPKNATEALAAVVAMLARSPERRWVDEGDEPVADASPRLVVVWVSPPRRNVVTTHDRSVQIRRRSVVEAAPLR